MRTLTDAGIFEDSRGVYRQIGGSLDRKTFDRCCCRLGRNNAPALLFDLYFGRSLKLSRREMEGVVAGVWSGAEYPQRCIEDPSLWRTLFAANGYSQDGERADKPAASVVLYRGSTPEGRFGMSWTTDLSVARSFADDGLRGRAQGQVYTAVVAPTHLLAYIGPRIGRDESEYVVDPSGLSDRTVTMLARGAR